MRLRAFGRYWQHKRTNWAGLTMSDLLVVADHSDGMGFFPQLIGTDPVLMATPQGRKWYDQINSGEGATAAIDIITSFGKGQLPKGFPTSTAAPSGRRTVLRLYQRTITRGRAAARCCP
jgi:hypothetical protein